MGKKQSFYRVRIKVSKPTTDARVRYKPIFYNSLVVATSPTESAQTVLNELRTNLEDKTLKLQITKNENLRIDFVCETSKN